MSRIEAVISDFGGVLTTPLMGSFMAVQDEIGIPAKELGKAMRKIAAGGGANPLHEMECGRLSEADFLEAVSDALEPELGHRPRMHRYREVFFGALDPNGPMIDLMRGIGDRGTRMALLTNNVREWEPYWRSMIPVDEIFEVIVDSAFVDCRKPDPEIYRLTLDRLGLEPSACLFVDDMEVNCEGAERVGIKAVHFRENAQARREIEAALSAGAPAGPGPA